MRNRLDQLNARRSDSDVMILKSLNESYRSIAQSESVKYTIGAMQPIDPEYTRNTFAQGDRVCNQLRSRLKTTCEYEYQGSVTNDTHIRARSDIDVLALIERFYTLEPPQRPTAPYAGDPLQDLLDLRSETVEALSAAFPEASVDSTGSKSITVEGGSLKRKIDVVPSNWWNSNTYVQTRDKTYRGVEILDSKKRERIRNTPFLHNARIETKDRTTRGGLRKVARLMKSLKYDATRMDLSSYDIVAIAFNMEDGVLTISRGAELTLLDAALSFCRSLQANASLRDSLVVPNGQRKVFGQGFATIEGLNQLTIELAQLSADVLQENRRSFMRLAEARVQY
jgi:hypothetical protein